jgi:hypothetical protein
MDPLGTGKWEGGMRIAGLAVLGLVGASLALPQTMNFTLATFGLLGVVLLAIGSIGRDRGHR